jgi:hypothetical protein
VHSDVDLIVTTTAAGVRIEHGTVGAVSQDVESVRRRNPHGAPRRIQ